MKESKYPPSIYRLSVKRPAELLQSLFDQFSSDHTLISLQGDLSYCDASGMQIVFQEPADVLSPSAASHRGEVVLLLNEAARKSFERNVLGRAGINSRIYHILIAMSDTIVFASYDNFEEGSVWVTAAVSEEWLNKLVNSQVIKSFGIAELS